jgi:hypothetical protein
MSERPAPTPRADHQRVLLVYTLPPLEIVADDIAAIRANGGRVDVVGPRVKGFEISARAADHFTLLVRRSTPVKIDPDDRPRKYSMRWVKVVATNLSRKALFRSAKRVLGAATLWWMSAAQNRKALDLIDGADVITALDAGAIYLCWQAGRRNRGAAVINGIGPTMEHLGLVR